MSDTSDSQVSTMGFDDFYEAGVRTIDDLTPEEVAALGPKSLGSLGEVLAACYLDARGYEVLEHNYRCPEGEADLIAYDPESDDIVLVEVKTRRARASDQLFPEEAVDNAKRRRYRRIAACYIMDHYPVLSMRFDVIAITIIGDNDADLSHYFDVFGWEAGR